jgi:hypothetical protein
VFAFQFITANHETDEVKKTAAALSALVENLGNLMKGLGGIGDRMGKMGKKLGGM